MSSKMARSSSSQDELVSALQALSDQGKLHDVLSKLQMPAQSSSMTDASKRRSPESVICDSSDDGFDLLKEDQDKDVGQSQMVNGCKLPPKIANVHMWGRTLCVLPKVEELKKSYAELVAMAETDAPIAKYLDWIQKHPERSEKVKDFAEYLGACGYASRAAQKSESVLKYPGSDEVRILK